MISLNKKDVKDVVVSVWVVRMGWNMNMADYRDVIVEREKGRGENRWEEDGMSSGWPNDVCMYTTNMSE